MNGLWTECFDANRSIPLNQAEATLAAFVQGDRTDVVKGVVLAGGSVHFAAVVHHPGTPGAYLCFRPLAPVPVLRYTSVSDPTGTPSTSTDAQIHRASAVRESAVVGGWSTACTVVANPTDYAHLIALAEAQALTGRKRFTVSLMEWPA